MQPVLELIKAINHDLMQEHKGITQALALATFVQGCGEKRQGRQKVTKLKLKHFWGEKQRESQRRHLRLLGHAVTSQLTVASWRGISALGRLVLLPDQVVFDQR